MHSSNSAQGRQPGDRYNTYQFSVKKMSIIREVPIRDVTLIGSARVEARNQLTGRRREHHSRERKQKGSNPQKRREQEQMSRREVRRRTQLPRRSRKIPKSATYDSGKSKKWKEKQLTHTRARTTTFLREAPAKKKIK